MKFLFVSFLFMAAFWTFLETTPAWAAPAKSKPVVEGEAPLVTMRGQARRLFIVGFAGQVNVIPGSRNDQVVVHALKYMDKEDGSEKPTETLDQLVVRSTNLGDTVEVRAQLPPNGVDWARWASGKNVPKVKLEVVAPENMMLEVYWTHGDVHVPRWKSSVLVTSQEGHVSVEDVTGDVMLRGMFGALKAENIKGSLSVENFSCALNVSDVTGKVKIRNFSGETHVKKVTGPVSLSSQKGAVTTQETQGALDLQSGIAAIHVLEHKGSLVGHSDGGAITARVVGQPVDVRLTSVSGPLTLAVPPGSQASVSLFTNEGHLSAPSSLEEKREPAGRLVKGKLNGGSGDSGRVRLSSDSGDLSLKL